MRIFNVLIQIVIVPLLAGCSFFTAPKLRPVIEDKVGKLGEERAGTLAMTAERRIVLVNLDTGKFCAEPSPDAAENVANNFAGSAAATTPEGIQAQVAIANAFAANAKQLFARSQGVQLYRDGTYALCQALLNGVITTEAEYRAAMTELLDSSTKLVIKELERGTPGAVEKVKPATPAALKQMEITPNEAKAADPKSHEKAKAQVDSAGLDQEVPKPTK